MTAMTVQGFTRRTEAGALLGIMLEVTGLKPHVPGILEAVARVKPGEAVSVGA
jgi:hypothetical protein